jgi:ribonuclease R
MNLDTEKIYDQLKSICEHSSVKERLADKIEREVNHYKMAEFMEHHIGEYFEGYITYIGNHGTSIRTKSGISGKISMDLLNHLGFNYNSEKKKLINKETGIVLYIGDEINIISKSANKDNGKIEFTFINKIDKSKEKIKSLIK